MKANTWGSVRVTSSGYPARSRNFLRACRSNKKREIYEEETRVIKLRSISDVDGGRRRVIPFRKHLLGDKFSMNYRIDCSRVCDSLNATSETLTVISHVFHFYYSRSKRVQRDELSRPFVTPLPLTICCSCKISLLIDPMDSAVSLSLGH